MKIRSILPLLVLAAISFSLAWYILRQDSDSPSEREGGAGSILVEQHGEHWRAVDTRSGVMGTRFSIEVAASGEDTARRACAEAYATLSDIEARLSTWRPASTLSLLNGSAHESPYVVDKDTFIVIDLARAIHELTGGAFDPTVGPVVKEWRKAATSGVLPSKKLLSAKLAQLGMTHVTLDGNDLSVSFDSPDVALDLGGIAKGYAASSAAAAALGAGAVACRVNAGGDHVAFGIPPWSPGGFRVAIRDPLGEETDTLEDVSFLLTSGEAVATSGNYERFSEIDGRKYSHIIDPKTGWPVENPVVQVTVVAGGGYLADALATALTVLGSEKGLELVEGLSNVEAMFILRKGDRLERVSTSGFPGAPR